MLVLAPCRLLVTVSRENSPHLIPALVFWSDAMATFDLTVELRYVEEAVRYRPAFWELIKNAWVQVTTHTSPSVSLLLLVSASVSTVELRTALPSTVTRF